MTSAEAAVVHNQIVVEAPIARAFAVFTERFGDFKPPEHNLLDASIAETVFEPHVGGHIYDRAVDGSECRWARVLTYEPPDRVVFSWDISPQWQLETDPSHTSEVDVRFIAETPPAPALNWNTATSTGTGRAGGKSAMVWATTPDGRCTWPSTRPCFSEES